MKKGLLNYYATECLVKKKKLKATTELKKTLAPF